jgi:hypothetical protein
MIIRKSTVVLSLLLGSATAVADELTMVPSIGYGVSNLDFSRSTGESDDTRFNMIDLGLTASYGNSYLKLSGEIPMGEEYTVAPGLVRQIKREDFGASLGYYLQDNLSIFGGYSYGKTSIIANSSGSGYAVYTSHRDHGLFVGTTYSVFFGDSGSVSFNLAYADMFGRLVVEDTAPAGSDSDYSGKTNGFSLAATWSDTYKEKLTYYLSYKRKQYRSHLGAVTVDKSFENVTFGFVFPI